MTSLVRISHLPAFEEAKDEHEQAKPVMQPLKVDPDDTTAKSRVNRLLSLKEKMQELKKRSDSLENLWKQYEKTRCEEVKAALKMKISEKTESADSLASKIYRSIELEEMKKQLIAAKYETDIAIQRSPAPSPSPRSQRSFF